MAVSAYCAAGERDGPPDSGVRGRPKRKEEHLADREAERTWRRAERWLRVGAVVPQGWVGNTVWRIKRRPVWNSWAARPPGWSLKAGWGAGALAHNRI
jgi:hypothetical protein